MTLTKLALAVGFGLNTISLGAMADVSAIEDIAQESDVWGLAAVYSTQNVIAPSETRDYLIRMLELQRLRLSNGIGKHLMQYWPTTI